MGDSEEPPHRRGDFLAVTRPSAGGAHFNMFLELYITHCINSLLKERLRDAHNRFRFGQH
jgi:hypothetical protein